MNIVSQIFLPLSLAFIMFSMGLTLTVTDFKRVFLVPKAFSVGLFAQMIALPLFAFLLVLFWMNAGNLTPTMAVGMMILAACPGGVTSNVLTHLAKGDTALSISLTAVISVLSVFSIPFIVNFSLFYFMGANAVALPIGKTIAGVFLISTVPVVIGMLLKSGFPRWTKKSEPLIRRAAAALFVVVILGAIAKERHHLMQYFAEVGPASLTLNLIIMAFAFQLAKWFKLKKPQAIAISLEGGLQNGTLAIFIALTLMGNQKMMMPGAIYSVLMFFTSVGFLLFVTGKYQSRK